MRLLFPAGLLCTLQVCSHLGETSAKPLTSLVELSIRREFSADGLPFMSVRDVVLTDRESFPLTDYQPNSTTVTVLDHLLAMHRQKRETSIYMKRKELSKRQTFGGRTKQCEKKKKYKLCDGIYKMFWNALTKTCETCEAGKEPTSKGDKCVEPETPEQEKERGKCPLGKKLDPNVPGQDHNTLNPKCVDKDGEQNRCPGGQSESTPTKEKPGKCAPDDEPDKKCDNKDTSIFKEIGPDGKMKNSCRTTRDREQKKSSEMTGKMREAGDKVMKPKVDEAKDKRKKENKARARRSACLALGAMSFIPEADVQALGELELEGIIEPDDLSHVPDIDIEDYMVSITTPSVAVVNIEMETAGPNFGALVKALVRLFKGGSPGGKAAERPQIPATRPSRVFGGEGKGLGTGAQRFGDLRRKDSLRNEKRASPQSKEAAKNSGAVQNILKSKTFQECLAVGAGTALGAAATKRQENSNKYQTDIEGGLRLIIDLDAPKKDNFPSPEDDNRILLLVADDVTDAGDDETPNIQLKTYQDSYNRDDRLYYQSCGSFAGWSVDNKITLLQTWNGCCKYYNGEKCEPDTGLFKQTDREDGQLDGAHNDAVSSFWCSFDANCAGAPGG